MRFKSQPLLPTIRKKLSMLVLACALPAAVGFALLINHFYEREKSQIQSDSLLIARTLISSTDQELIAGIRVAAALASSPNLANNDLSAFYVQAKNVLRDDSSAFNFVLSDQKSVQLLNTARPYGELIADPGSLDRVQKVFNTGKPIISDIFIGGALRRPLVAIHVPVFNNGKVIYCLSSAFLPERLGKILTGQRLPTDRIVAVIDTQGVIAARTHDPQKFVGQKAAASLLAKLQYVSEETIEATTLEGIRVYSMFSRSPSTGWAVVVGVPRSTVLTELLSSLAWISLTVLILFAAGFSVAWFLGNNISNSVSGLSTYAIALGSGAPMIEPRSSFREAQQAAATLKSVETELVSHRHHLENLIAERTAQLNLANEQMVSARDTAEASNRKLLESQQEAIDNELRIRTVVESVGEGIITLDERGLIASFNGAAATIFGYAPDEIIGSNIQRLMPPDLRPLHQAGMARYLAGGEPTVVGKKRVELPGLHKNGNTFLLELAINAIEIKGKQLFVGIVRDITEQKRSEQAVRVAMEEAQLANSAKSAFVANMSHELRTPMNAVLGMTHLIGTTSLSPEQRRYLEMIRTSGQSLLGILNDILDFSKIEAGKVELSTAPFELQEVLHTVAAIMSVNAGDKDLELAIGVELDVPHALVGDATRLQQVLVNLTGNAIKFTHRGEVSVLVKCVSRQPGFVMLRFIVRDTGIGISAAQQKRLFSPFTQADSSTTRRFGGSGLGLTISKGLVERLGGTIELWSKPDQGSEFSCTLPFSLQDCEVRRSLPDSRLSGLRLLVVDDNATSRAYLRMTIQAWNWEVDSVASGSEALDAIRTLQAKGGAYDVIIIDLHMPEMDGIATIRAIRARPNSEIPMIMMASAFERGKLVGDSAPESQQAMLTKPVTASSLFDIVHELLTQKKQSPSEQTPAPPTLQIDARLLLVEDNHLNQIVAKTLLELTGATVDVVENGQIALDLLRARPGDYDLILMDVQMPVMDGFTATRLIRSELHLNTPIIAMTAGVLESERERCTASGMNDFIGKPIDVDEMIDKIRQHLAPQ